MEEEIKTLDRQFVLSTYRRNYTCFVKGSGARLYDATDREYIDFTSGIGVTSIGHAHPLLAKAICEQANMLLHTSNLFAIEPQARLAKRLVELSGYDMGCFFANSGAEANEGAIKLARKYGEKAFQTKRYKVITLEHSFHGRTITTVKATGQEKLHQSHFSPYPDGFCYVSTIDAIYEAIDDKTVGVMIELVQGEGGVEPFDRSSIQKLAHYLREKNLLLIVDEVQTGIYRTGKFLASQTYGITPDIITLAKGLGGGVPIGVVMSSLKDLFEPGDHGSTFGGNFLSSRAALAVLDVLESEAKSGSLNETIASFDRAIQSFYEAYPSLFDKRVGLGLMQGLRVNTAQKLDALLESAHQEGVLVLKAGRNTLRFLPPLTITQNEINEGFARLNRAADRI